MLFSQSEHWNKNKETSNNRTTRGYFKILRYSLPLEYKLYYLQFFFYIKYINTIMLKMINSFL